MDSPLDGVALMDMFGRKPGPWIKPIKEFLLDMVLDGKLHTSDKEKAAILAKEFDKSPTILNK
jgi:poly(A) polymerase